MGYTFGIGLIPRRNRRRNGFTLIELLVVISIIALLIGILLPALGTAVQVSRSLKCATNQRSLAQGILLHANDNDDFHINPERMAPSDPVNANGGANTGRRPNGRYNSGLRFAPSQALGGRTNGGTRLFGPSYRGDQQNGGNNEAYWAIRYDEFLMQNAPHQSFQDLPQQRVGFGQPAETDFTRDYIEVSDDPEKFILQSWEITQCPEASFMAATYRLQLPYEPFGIYSSYCFNGYAPSDPRFVRLPALKRRPMAFFDHNYQPRRLSRIQYNIIMFQDGSEPFLEGGGDMLNGLTQDREDDNTGDVWIPEYFRHRGKCNVARLDGSSFSYSEEFPELGLAPYIGFDPLAPNGGSGGP